jgi:hypothetical protein
MVIAMRPIDVDVRTSECSRQGVGRSQSGEAVMPAWLLKHGRRGGQTPHNSTILTDEQYHKYA